MFSVHFPYNSTIMWLLCTWTLTSLISASRSLHLSLPTCFIAALLSQAARNHTNRKAQSLQRDLDKRLRDSRERHLAETEALRADVERLQVRASASAWWGLIVSATIVVFSEGSENI